MSIELVNVLKDKVKPGDVVELRKKDIVVKSKDRVTAKKIVEEYLRKESIAHQSVAKKSKSSSMDVTVVPSWNGIDIIYKPHKAKGAGGLDFEKQLAKDLEFYFNGGEIEFAHPDVIKAMVDEIGLKPNSEDEKWKIQAEGSKNQKRGVVMQGNNLVVQNSTGETLTDLTLVSSKGKKIYVSLKMSESYYLINAGVLQYFKSPSTKKAIGEFFGFEGKKLAGFGPEYLSDATSNPGRFSRVKSNLENLISQSLGTHVTIVHKKRTNSVNVLNIGASKIPVSISGLDANSYVYPEAGKRKYANIKCKVKVKDKQYEANFQFRGTTGADTGPRYLRLLMRAL
jgi:hypothetical protein